VSATGGDDNGQSVDTGHRDRSRAVDNSSVAELPVVVRAPGEKPLRDGAGEALIATCEHPGAAVAVTIANTQGGLVATQCRSAEPEVPPCRVAAVIGSPGIDPPSLVTARLCRFPAATSVTELSGTTSGSAWSEAAPFPSCPAPFAPQATTVPCAVRARVWSWPARAP